MDDGEFLHWMADRLVNVYGESENVDFVQKLRKMANKLNPQTDRARAEAHVWNCTGDLNLSECALHSPRSNSGQPASTSR